MSKIAVVTDSISCLPDEIRKKYSILVAPCYLMWDGVQYRDGIDITPGEVYARLRTSQTIPTTSSAVQGEFLQIFEALRGEVEGAVAVTVSGGMGSCHSSALAAKNLVPELPVEVVDSRNCYMGEGFAAQAAAEAARRGGTMEEVARAAREMAEKMHTVFYIDGMEYIKRCGRVRLPQDILDKWQKTKVLMILKDGKLDPHPLEQDPAEELLKTMEGMLAGRSGRMHAAIAHGDLDPSGLQKRIASAYSPVELLTCTLTPVAGVHTGPGIMGVNFYLE